MECRIRADILEKRQHQTVGKVWRQIHSVGGDLGFAILVGGAYLDLARRNVNPDFHRMLKRRPPLQQVITQKPELATLRKDAGLFVDGTILQVVSQLAVYSIRFDQLNEITVSQNLALRRTDDQKAVRQSFFEAHGHQRWSRIRA